MLFIVHTSHRAPVNAGELQLQYAADVFGLKTQTPLFRQLRLFKAHKFKAKSTAKKITWMKGSTEKITDVCRREIQWNPLDKHMLQYRVDSMNNQHSVHKQRKDLDETSCFQGSGFRELGNLTWIITKLPLRIQITIRILTTVRRAI